MQAIILNGITATRARVVTVRTNAREIDGISKVILIEQLKNKLKSGKIVKFAYLKSNGEVRIAFGTTNPDFVKDKVCGWGEVVKVMLLLHTLIWKNVVGVRSVGRT